MSGLQCLADVLAFRILERRERSHGVDGIDLLAQLQFGKRCVERRAARQYDGAFDEVFSSRMLPGH